MLNIYIIGNDASSILHVFQIADKLSIFNFISHSSSTLPRHHDYMNDDYSCRHSKVKEDRLDFSGHPVYKPCIRNIMTVQQQQDIIT